MNLGFVLPTMVGVMLVALMGTVQWNLRPKIAIPLLTAAMTIAASATVLMTATTAAAFALGPARAATLTDWCRNIPLHHEVGPFLGLAAITATAGLTIRCGRIIGERHRAVRSAKTSGRVSIIDSAKAFAYAVPTREGCVVVSTGLLAPLSTEERRAVFAHERAHLQLGHHRYLFAAELSRSVLPFFGPLAEQVVHATERAADEAAALAVQDRNVVARAITTTALGLDHQNATFPGLKGGSVTRRVEALLWPHQEPLATRITSGTALLAGLAVTGAAAVQVHHFSTLAAHLCHGISQTGH